MRLLVEILTGTLFYVELGNDATIGDLKREIATQQNVTQDRLILILDKNRSNEIIEDRLNFTNQSIQILDNEDGDSLVDCGVQHESHIYVFFNPLDDGSSHDFAFTWPESFLG
ncbi:hypothetical protein CFOL_v3_22494 [Cephalotus follicularis]|uniref:Ubiquitin-like domain-containing protein n=1 Tax=Cephalotus follicularis TaxID=3775 RepID=A0A1Q3CFM4_CEPFO|nr:hypothetical protein CFOL_v3_22494 [Cephalotus follicularis]